MGPIFSTYEKLAEEKSTQFTNKIVSCMRFDSNLTNFCTREAAFSTIYSHKTHTRNLLLGTQWDYELKYTQWTKKFGVFLEKNVEKMYHFE